MRRNEGTERNIYDIGLVSMIPSPVPSRMVPNFQGLTKQYPTAYGEAPDGKDRCERRDLPRDDAKLRRQSGDRPGPMQADLAMPRHHPE